MHMRKQRSLYVALSAVVLLALLGLVLSACGGSSQAPATSAPPQSGTIDAAALLQDRCGACHSAGAVTREKMDTAGWERTVNQMIQRGAQLSDAEKAALVQYLAANYGP
jgi:mono/diheme cytochrome c family protein